MARDFLLLLVLVAARAALFFVHGLLLVRVLRLKRIALGARLCGLLPPVLPVIAWRGGLRAGALVWLALAIGYACLHSALA